MAVRRHINMELEELGGEFPTRTFHSPVFGTHSNRSTSGASVYSLTEGPSSFSPECFTPYVPFSRPATRPSTEATFGCHYANSCYTCKVPPSAVLQQSGISHSVSGNVSVHSVHSADKQDKMGFCRATQHCNEVSGQVRELGISRGYTGSYARIPGYIDWPVAQREKLRDQRRESSFTAEGYQPWRWSRSWNGHVYCPKEQMQTSHIWKSSLTDDKATSRSDPRRLRKKRVPYTKLQLKELEHEYTITKFITKERRRRIASSTNLSERQVTIWFQNRRVKDKKIISKISKDFVPFQ